MGAKVHLLDKRRQSIQAMFDEVAPRYDLLNRLLSARQDVTWRRKAARALELAPSSRVLDLCCGTGDQAMALHEESMQLLAADFSLPMVHLARSKFAALGTDRPRGIVADVLDLPLPAGCFDAITVSFGLRNVEDLRRALTEMHRVLAPGGRAIVLEFAVPENPVLRHTYLFYFRHLLPRIGRLLSPRGSAYQYLTDSVPSFPQRTTFTRCLTDAGFERTSWRDLSGGIVCLYEGRRPA